MAGAICCECATNELFKKLIQEADEELVCTHCGEQRRPAISASALAAAIEPILREHFQQGKFGHDGLQDGEPLQGIVYEVIEQELEFVDEVVDEIIELDPAWPPDGEEPLWEEHAYYVETRVTSWGLFDRWTSALAELKHSRRFFSPLAAELFKELFEGVSDLKYWANMGQPDAGWRPVVFDLPAGTALYRARVCNSNAQRAMFFANPLKELGPPPPEAARTGRMNAEGVPVLYCAIDAATAIAEMRPAIGMELVVATFKTTEAVRVLDFSLLEEARGKALSYLQSDFNKHVERNHFLKRLHRLISQPVIPGREADYLITQTMAEYLSHLLDPPLGGVLFKSAQNNGGTNVVLFSNFAALVQETHESFPIENAAEPQVHQVRGVSYVHHHLNTVIHDDGQVSTYDPNEDHDDDDVFD